MKRNATELGYIDSEEESEDEQEQGELEPTEELEIQGKQKDKLTTKK